MSFLGVKVDKYVLAEALERARHFLIGGQHKIYTPNPEMLVKANKDSYFKTVLNNGDLNLCDGFGLRFFSGAPRIPGVDFMIELCGLAQREGKSIYLLGSGNDEVIKKCADELVERFPGLRIAGFSKGPVIDETIISSEPNQLINDVKPDILFVAFGMGKQEKWIHENLPKLPSVKIAMGVGGSFDFIAGKASRAPLFLRQIGLEWLYRLIRQPKRFRRIWNATVVFTYLVLKEKIYDHKN
jgi:N-acetylglucosaminyldiphosphoundecaprenol N-acetyl-beta-D-mannosaminyltransferase